MHKETIAELLTRKRIELGYSQAEMKRIFGIQQTQLSVWETGTTLPVKNETKLKLCKLYNIDIKEFNECLNYSKHLKQTGNYELHYQDLQKELNMYGMITDNELPEKLEQTIPVDDYRVLRKYFSNEDLDFIKDNLHKLKTIENIIKS